MSLYARLIAVLVLFGLLGAAMWGMQRRGQLQGRAEIQARWDKESRERAEAEKSALLARVKNNERIVEQQALDGQRIRKDVNNELNQIHAAYGSSGHADSGLRVSASICHGLAPAADTAGTAGSNAAAASTLALPPEIEGNLRNLMQEADTVVAGCRATQQFIRANHMYSGDSG